MNTLEKIKLIFGITLLSFAILGGLIFFLESFKLLNKILNYDTLSVVFEGGWASSDNGWSGGGASNVPLFLGLSGLAGAYLLASIKTNTIYDEKKK